MIQSTRMDIILLTTLHPRGLGLHVWLHFLLTGAEILLRLGLEETLPIRQSDKITRRRILQPCQASTGRSIMRVTNLLARQDVIVDLEIPHRQLQCDRKWHLQRTLQDLILPIPNFMDRRYFYHLHHQLHYQNVSERQHTSLPNPTFDTKEKNLSAASIATATSPAPEN